MQRLSCIQHLAASTLFAASLTSGTLDSRLYLGIMVVSDSALCVPSALLTFHGIYHQQLRNLPPTVENIACNNHQRAGDHTKTNGRTGAVGAQLLTFDAGKGSQQVEIFAEPLQQQLRPEVAIGPDFPQLRQGSSQHQNPMLTRTSNHWQCQAVRCGEVHHWMEIHLQRVRPRDLLTLGHCPPIPLLGFLRPVHPVEGLQGKIQASQ
jgi:hypothetical protein